MNYIFLFPIVRLKKNMPFKDMYKERVMSLELTAFSLGSAAADYQLSYTRNKS